ncbi:metalloregulator ArsR/SmtB family transcription factor [Shouchella sp. 1P09AA]|uniref:ArsR/SmtB family transcription factor n=1 Tax=unclassified Shouchella TaxID=2893065 RepID=UPI0039A01714
MDIIHSTVRKRKSYQVEVKYSILWECALGIAAITNEPLHETLERPISYWDRVKSELPASLLRELEYVQKHNTWKGLLQLLHELNEPTLDEFINFIKTRSSFELKYHCLPFVGEEFQEFRERAAKGDDQALDELKKIAADNPFFPAYMAFIVHTDVKELTNHLVEVMSQWYEHVVLADTKETEAILQTDYEAKIKMQNQLGVEAFVQWATGGISYQPEPHVYSVLLIPQICYRPWSIEADIEGKKVFYYPVSNASLRPGDLYASPDFLVQKYKALGDDVRLKVVKMLSEGDRSLQEITEQLALGKSTVHHHLKLLRSAKLVEVKEQKYSLKREALQLMNKELEEYVERQH